MTLTRHWTERELAYFAGIIDGEGCFCLHNAGTHRFASQLHIGNTSPQLMDWIRSTFDGQVHAEKRRDARRKPIFRWYADADDLMPIIEAIRPYLVVKHAQADLFLAYRRTLAPKVRTKRSTNDTDPAVKRERFRIHSDLRALNKRGIA